MIFPSCQKCCYHLLLNISFVHLLYVFIRTEGTHQFIPPVINQRKSAFYIDQSLLICQQADYNFLCVIHFNSKKYSIMFPQVAHICFLRAWRLLCFRPKKFWMSKQSHSYIKHLYPYIHIMNIFPWIDIYSAYIYIYIYILYVFWLYVWNGYFFLFFFMFYVKQ